MAQVINSSCGSALCSPCLSMLRYWYFTISQCVVSTSSLNGAPGSSRDSCCQPGTGFCHWVTSHLPQAQPCRDCSMEVCILTATQEIEWKPIFSFFTVSYGHTGHSNMILYFYSGRVITGHREHSQLHCDTCISLWTGGCVASNLLIKCMLNGFSYRQ